MTNRFPGVNPFLEAAGFWQGFHNKFITYMDEALNRVLPENYFAQTDVRTGLVSREADPAEYIPDVMIVKDDRTRIAYAHEPALATIEPVSIPLARIEVEEIREAWLEIRKLPDEELITVVELLSPSNKIGRGRVEYLEKRDELIDQAVHLVEIDLLLKGSRLPMLGPLPEGHFYAFVARADRRPNADVYAWTLRQPIPTLPIPLKTPDPDIPLDLNAIFQATFDRGRFARITRYGSSLDLPLSAEDRSWTESLRPAP